MRLSPYQMTEATSWKGLTTDNHLGAMWRREPELISNMVTEIQAANFGNNIDNMLAKFPTKYIEHETDFTWELRGSAPNNFGLVECRVNGTAVSDGDQIGLGFGEFELVFSENWFSQEQVIGGEHPDDYQIKILDEPTPEGGNYVYRCILSTGDSTAYIPYSEVEPGTRWSYEFTPVEDTLSRRGSKIGFTTNLSMRNGITHFRMEHETPGNMKQRRMTTAIYDKESGKAFNVWQDYQSYIFDYEFRMQKNRFLMFGRTNKNLENGQYYMRGTSGYPIKIGAGIRQQMEVSHTRNYQTFSLNDLTETMLELSIGKKPFDQRKFVLKTGEYGAKQFHEAILAETSGYSPLQGDYLVQKDSSPLSSNSLSYGGQFTRFKAPNGVELEVSVDSMYDDLDRNKVKHPDGGVLESYRYDIFDIGTTNGDPNIQLIKPMAFKADIHKYIPGMRDPFTGDVNTGATVSPVDGWTEHKFTAIGVAMRDPSTSATWKCNLV